MNNRILYLVLLCLSISTAFAQDKVLPTYAIHTHNKSLLEIIEELENSYALSFAYNPEILVDATLLPQRIESESLTNFLHQLFYRSGLQYQVHHHEILLRTEKRDYITWLGQVRNESNDPLPFAHIQILETEIGTFTNEEGIFRLKIKDHIIDDLWAKISYLGHESILIPLDDLDFSISHTYALPLKENQLSGLIITETPLLPVEYHDNKTTFQRDSNFSSSAQMLYGNLFKKLQYLPGIAAYKDFSSGLKIRGGSSDESLILLDGITLWNTQHMFGLFSSVNFEYVESFDLYKSYFPAKFGGKTSGILDIKTLPLFQSKFQWQTELGLLNSAIQVQLPVFKNIQLLFSARKTNEWLFDTPIPNLDWNKDEYIKPPVIARPGTFSTAVEPGYRFEDLFGKVSWRLSQGQQLDLTYFSAKDDYQYKIINEFQTSVIQGQKRSQIQETRTENTHWNNTGWSVNYQLNLPSNQKLAATLSQSEFQSEANLNAQFQYQSPMAVELDRFRQSSDNYSNIQSFKAQSQYYLINQPKQNLALGYEYEQVKNLTHLVASNRFQDQVSQLHSLFGDYTLRINSNWTLETGLRNQWYDATQKNYLSPRISMSYDINPQWTMFSSFGQYYQFAQWINSEDVSGRMLQIWALADGQRFTVAQSNQYAMGSQWNRGDWSFTFEGYIKKTVENNQNLLTRFQTNTENNPLGYVTTHQLFHTTSRTKGLEFQVNYQRPWIKTQWSYTLSEKIDNIFLGRRWLSIPAMDDSRHQGNVLIDIFPIPKLKVMTAYTFATGHPYIDYVQIYQQGMEVRKSAVFKNSINRLPSYHRFDFGMTYRFRWQNSNLDLGFNLFNLFDTKNIDYLQFNARPGAEESQTILSTTEVHQLGRTFNIFCQLRL